MKIVSVLFFVTTLLGCAAVAEDETNVETLHGMQWLEGEFSIQVTSNGCTTPDSFEVDSMANGVLIRRTKPDLCRRLAYQTWVTIEPIDQQIVVLNPLAAP